MFPAMPILTAIRTEAAPNGPTVEAFSDRDFTPRIKRIYPAFRPSPYLGTVTGPLILSIAMALR